MDPRAELLVVIVPGAVARETTFVWMEDLRRHLVDRGIPRVELFPWSGRVGRASLELAGRRFAAALESWIPPGLSLADPQVLPVRVYAKSAGALVVRNGLNVLLDKYPGCRLQMLLQVASPNPPKTEDSLCAFSRVVNVYSADDAFLKFFIRVGLFWRHRQRLETDLTSVQNIEIQGITHHAFNTNAVVETGSLAETRLFDYYYELLSDQASV